VPPDAAPDEDVNGLGSETIPRDDEAAPTSRYARHVPTDLPLPGDALIVRSPRADLPVVDDVESVRADAVRNRSMLLTAAQRLVEQHGASGVTMDEVARAAGVGKGTVFRRFGTRAGLMRSLLDHSETEMQRSFLSGPPPLGPGAPARERLVAYGRARLAMVCAHLDILTEADEAAGPLRLDHPARRVSAIHVQSLLVELGFTAPAVAVREAVMAPLEPAVVGFLLHREGMTLEEMGDHFEEFVRSLHP
jgi:AcrR family transcriptional regulator